MTSFYSDKTKLVCSVFEIKIKNVKLAEMGVVQGSLIITAITCSREELFKLGAVQRFAPHHYNNLLPE